MSVAACLFAILLGWIIMPRRLCSLVAIKHATQNPVGTGRLGWLEPRKPYVDLLISGASGGMPVSRKAITRSSTAANSPGHSEIKNLVFG